MQVEQKPVKRQSLYTCIRYASKLIKMRTDIRKHRTLPNDYCDLLYTKDEKSSPACFYRPELSLPPKITFLSAGHEEFDEKQELKQAINQDLFDEEDEDKESSEVDYDSEEAEIDRYYTDEYDLTLQKLTGKVDNATKRNTAVRIKMSPNALAAANAARQRRQKTKTAH
ncbi:uncharacterized protein B0P05DRAFT_548292 [Gilbertella persicaria]|uniref:uncharacterized protein n=1 Tax=Gilbertella persicaria TaxID=101096 RepID=UPI00221FA701|nr:uncharacterized protein B0P05DRAFT_548292 [Gilbertella persicaria]KAI8073391.1 hypothetical protein B0P05DRAFT_548292 [Gilbertella persicaria]